jgi:hypothetical protein
MMGSYDQIIALDGMTDTIAKQLVEIGLDTYYEIYRLNPSTLMEKLNDPSLTSDLVARWQKDAVKLDYTRTVEINCMTKDNKSPLVGATVIAGGVQTLTDENGKAILQRVRIDCKSIVVSKPGYLTLTANIDLRANQTHKLTFSLAQSKSNGQYGTYNSEYNGQHVSVLPGDIQRLRTRELTELPSGTYLQVTREDVEKSTLQLVSLFREKDGNVIYTDRVILSKDELPADVSVGVILHLLNGVLHVSEETKASIALLQREKVWGIPRDAIIPKIKFNHQEKLTRMIELPQVELSQLSVKQKGILKDMFEKYPTEIPYHEFKNTLTILSVMGGNRNV